MGFNLKFWRRNHAPDPDLPVVKRKVEDIVKRSERVAEYAEWRKKENNFTQLAANIFRGD